MGRRLPGKETILIVLSIVLLAGIVLCLNLPWSPAFKGQGPDSGLYAYVGTAIVHGQLPYRDVWEQKPPVGFYLNALAVFLFGQTPWAIWWFNLIWVTLSVIAFFLVIRMMMGWLTALVASLIFVLGVMHPSVYQGGNLMEVYGLLPQVLVIGAAYLFFSARRNRWVFFVGILTGIAFLTKQTTVALGFSSLLAILVITLLWREFKNLLLRPALFVAGFLVPVGIATFYWLVMGAIHEYLAGVLLSGLSYAGEGAPFLWSLRHTVTSVFPDMFISRLYYLAAVSFLLYLAENFRSYLRQVLPAVVLPKLERILGLFNAPVPPVELAMLPVFIALPFELVFASLGGRNLGHYYLSLVPAVTAAIAYCVWKITAFVQDGVRKTKKVRLLLVAGWMVLGIGALFWCYAALKDELPTSPQLASLPQTFHARYELNDLETYVVEQTQPDDPVLVWHIHVGINFVTNRRPPQRILYPALLFIPTAGKDQYLAEFLQEMDKNPPKLILVQKISSIGLPFVNVPVDKMCPNGACIPELAAAMQRPDALADLARLRRYFLDHYTFDTQIYDWLIYRRTP